MMVLVRAVVVLVCVTLARANIARPIKYERSYNDVDFYEFNNISDLKDRFFNEEGHIAVTNVLLGVATPQCFSHLQNPSFRGFQRHAGGKTVVSASLPASETPEPVANRMRIGCAELYFYPKGSSINESPKAIYDKSFDYDTIQAWQKRIVKGETRFYNDFDFPIELYWNDEGVKSVLVGKIEPGGSIFQNTFIGHIFSARSIPPVGVASSDVLTIDYTVFDGSSYRFGPHNRLDTCDFDSKESHYDYEDQMMTREIQCDDMALRFEKFKLEVLHSKRLGLNYVQPSHIPAFTAHGFEKVRLPEDTYKWLKDWYDEVKAAGRITQVESSAGPCMNQVDSPSIMHMITPQLKIRMADELKPLLEAWYGHGSLKMTSIYGVRKYTDGSILRMHVDTANTHVISAIINVDQNVDEPWPLLILDHEENEHWITMEPGDMVLYESAKALHGRPKPMRGERYENIFLHYMPTEGWDYY